MVGLKKIIKRAVSYILALSLAVIFALYFNANVTVATPSFKNVKLPRFDSSSKSTATIPGSVSDT
mgnify:CR=1 FL=1